jgi:hypothetical protein
MIKGCLAVIGGIVVVVFVIGIIAASHSSSSSNNKYDTSYSSSSTASTDDSDNHPARRSIDYCAEALAYVNMATSSGVSHQGTYADAVKGLAENEQCGDDTQHPY